MGARNDLTVGGRLSETVKYAHEYMRLNVSPRGRPPVSAVTPWRRNQRYRPPFFGNGRSATVGKAAQRLQAQKLGLCNFGSERSYAWYCFMEWSGRRTSSSRYARSWHDIFDRWHGLPLAVLPERAPPAARGDNTPHRALAARRSDGLTRPHRRRGSGAGRRATAGRNHSGAAGGAQFIRMPMPLR